MRALGIDTATWRASVGLAVDGNVVRELSLQTNGNHAVSLLDMIDEVLRDSQADIGDVDLIAVSTGPGSFSGLRIGLSVAKGLAHASDVPVAAVSTLEALARTVADRVGTICPVLDARKGELYAAAFESGATSWCRLQDDALVRPEALVESLPKGCIVLGDAVLRYGEFFAQQVGATVLPFEIYGPRGGTVALLGVEHLRRHGRVDLTALEPVYIRPSEAEVKMA